MQLLERESYIEELNCLLDRIPSVGGCVALISGEAGIGKTSLLREFAAVQNKAACVLWGGCEALFTPHPLAPLQDISRQIGGDFPEDDLRGTQSARDLQCHPRPVRPPAGAHGRCHRGRPLGGCSDARPHQVPRPAARPAGRHADGELSRRRGERQASASLGDRRSAAGSLCRIRLQPLSEGAVGLLAAAAGRSPTGLHEVTGGNPFFVTEVLAASEDKVPSTVRDAVIARLARLSEEARSVGAPGVHRAEPRRTLADRRHDRTRRRGDAGMPECRDGRPSRSFAGLSS